MSTRLADLYDADRHTAGRDDVPREDVLVPHPLTGVRYADGTHHPSAPARWEVGR